MNRIRKCKKGILFTIGLTFLALVILALAALVFHNAQEYEGLIAKLAVLDRVYDLDTSIGQSVGVILNLKSGILINITDESISFEETLPNGNIKVFNNSLHQFKRFIETNLSNVNLSIGDMGEMPLRIMPDDITYNHKDNWSDIEVVPNSAAPGGYSIFIEIDKNVSCTSTFGSGSFIFNYEVRGDVDSDSNCDYTSGTIAPADDKQFSIRDIDEDVIIIVIKVDSNKRLLINLTEDITATVRTTVMGVSDAEIRADSVFLTLDFGDFGVRKASGVRII